MSDFYKRFVDEEVDEYGNVVKYKVNPGENFNFAYDVVDELAKINPNKRALLWVSKNDEVIDFSFSDLSLLSNKCANFLVSKGLKKGDKVMLVLKRHWQFWVSILALHKIGAVVIPATSQLYPKDFVYRFKAADVKAVIATVDDNAPEHIDEAIKTSQMDVIKIAAGEAEGFYNFNEEIEKQSDVFERPTDERNTKSTDPMLLYFTSGTTGYPKMVYHDFSYPLGHIVTAKYWHNVREDGLHLTVAETGWGKAVWGKLYGQMIMEAPIFVYDMERFHADDLLKKIQDFKITTFCAPPTIYRFFIKEDLSKYDLSSLKYATIAGEALNPEVYNKFYQYTGLKLMEGFGQTETVLIVANLKGMEPKPGSMGKPVYGFDVKILDENNNPVQPGEVGQITVNISKGKPVGLFCGYLNDEEKTNSVKHDGYYFTGDMAYMDEDGYFWYEGRADDIIKSSGYRIGPFEIESVLMEHPSVLECAITGVPDPIRGQVVKATIVLAKGYEKSDELAKELQNYVKTHTAPYKYPRIIEFMDELPKTISGKIRRVELREKK